GADFRATLAQSARDAGPHHALGDYPDNGHCSPPRRNSCRAGYPSSAARERDLGSSLLATSKRLLQRRHADTMTEIAEALVFGASRRKQGKKGIQYFGNFVQRHLVHERNVEARALEIAADE